MAKNEKTDVLTPSVLDTIDVFSGMPKDDPATNAMQTMADGGAMQQVKTGYTTAVSVQKPRSLSLVVNKVLEESALAGQNFYYGWNVKSKDGTTSRIEGPSIDLAMCLSRNFGNCAVDIDCQETPTHYLFTGTFIDLETGFTLPRMFRQRKSQGIGGKMGKERAEDIVFQIGQSKAQRNAVVKAMPGWLILKAISVAKESERRTIENLHESRAQVVGFFRDKYGISPDRIENSLGRYVDNWTKDDIVNLRSTYTAIKENRVTADEAFPPIDQEKGDTNGKEKAPVKEPEKSESESEDPGKESAGDEGGPETDDGGDGDQEINYKGKLMVAKKNDPDMFKKACLDMGTDSQAIPRTKAKQKKLYEIYLNNRDFREKMANGGLE